MGHCYPNSTRTNADLHANTAFKFLNNAYRPPQQKSALAKQKAQPKMPRKDAWMDVAKVWFFETGTKERTDDATSHPVTQALLRDEGVQKARRQWIKKPNKKPFRYHFSVGEYLRELLELDGTRL